MAFMKGLAKAGPFSFWVAGYRLPVAGQCGNRQLVTGNRNSFAEPPLYTAE